MFSRVVPGFLYTDVTPDITETDLDIVADTWEMDGREVYRGVRDPRYDHASVFWLYDDTLERVGCAEHSLTHHSDMRLLWFRDSEFGTLLQEDGWEEDGNLWSKLPQTAFDRCLNEGWTQPEVFLEHCLHGPLRIVTPSMLVVRPTMVVCQTCGRRSLRSLPPGCQGVRVYLDFPSKEKTFFVDFDFIVYRPPESSSAWERLTTPTRAPEPSLEPQEQPVQVPTSEEERQEAQRTEPRSPPEEESPPQAPLAKSLLQANGGGEE